MKKILKSLGLCLGLLGLNFLIGVMVSIIFSIFIEDFNKLNRYVYIITFIGDIITLILVQSLMYNKKLLSKNTFKKVNLNKVINISLFGVGLTVILLCLINLLPQLIPSYMNVQNQIQSASHSLFQLIMVILLVPIYEEIIYRYVIFGYLKENYNIVFAVIVQALFFGLSHFNIVQGIYTFLLGIALALVYMYSKSLVGSIILHITFNLCGVLIIPKLVSINPIMKYIIIIFGIMCLAISVLKIKKEYKEHKKLYPSNLYETLD